MVKEIYKNLVYANKILLNGDIIYVYIEKEDILKTLEILRNNSNLKFNCLLDVWGVDEPSEEERFEVNYCLLSIHLNKRIIIKLRADESSGVESATGIYKGASWLEREVWDMYGVRFMNHPDLRRILSDYGFEGHPLRKDFPLSGYTEVRYDDEEKRVIEEPIEMAQEYRSFDFKSPWVNKN